MNKIYHYRLECEDESVLLFSYDAVNLEDAVKTVLSEMSDEEIIDPMEDWFLNIVNRIRQKYNCFAIEEVDCYVEDHYWNEFNKRDVLQE